MSLFSHDIAIESSFSMDARAVVHHGSCKDLLAALSDRSIQLVATSPPYNIGKEYEKRLKLDDYIAQQKEIITECERVLTDVGSIVWQVGNYVDNGAITPLDSVLYPIFRDLGLVMRNRIVWHFEHGLHCSKRFSGRYETLIWFTRDQKDYTFHLDPVRVPQKYPAKKHFQGPKTGQYSCNPLGKNPGDVWVIPNVKSNHVEKTDHPCQFPVELIERLVLSMTDKNDWVLDPFLGTGTTVIAALLHDRRGAGAELCEQYAQTATERIRSLANGELKTRPMNTPVYTPAHKPTRAPKKSTQPDLLSYCDQTSDWTNTE